MRGVVGVRLKKVSTESSSRGACRGWGERRVGREGARVLALRGRSFTKCCSGGNSLTLSSDSTQRTDSYFYW